MVDVTARARVLGIETQFVNLRTGSIANLPQQLGVLAQKSSAVSYGTTKFQATSAPEVARKLGWGSPAHLIAEKLFPANGDGVGTVPVTFFPLGDDGSGVASVGDITPSGTATKAQSWQIRVAGILSLAFVIPLGVVDATATCAKIGETRSPPARSLVPVTAPSAQSQPTPARALVPASTRSR